MAIKFSEAIRKLDIAKFKRENELKIDAGRYCETNKIDQGGINYIALRLAFGNTITVHTLTDGVAAKVKNTTICTMPCEMPHFLTKPFIIEARHDNCLFDKVTCLAGYLSRGDLFLISIFNDGGSLVQHEVGSYNGRKIQDINFYEYGASCNADPERKDTYSFATIFALMIEADRTPIVVEEKKVRFGKGSGIKSSNYKSDWIEKRVYIDCKYVSDYKGKTHGELDKDGKILKDIFVHGFLRYQAYGPGHSLRKWIYVEGFDSTRWATPGDTKIIVDMYEKS